MISEEQTLMIVTYGASFCFVHKIEREIILNCSVGVFLVIDQSNLPIQFNHQNPLSIIGDFYELNLRFFGSTEDCGLKISPIIQQDGSAVDAWITNHQNLVISTYIASLTERTKDSQPLTVKEGLGMKERSQTQDY